MIAALSCLIPAWSVLLFASALQGVPGGATGEHPAEDAALECFDDVVDAPLIIFISIDTLRADFLGCHGNSWIETPYVDALARESIQFTDCMTVAPTTAASHTSMFTGNYPRTHGVPRNAYLIPDVNIMLPEVLAADGYETVAIIAASPLMKTFNFDQGFDVFDDSDLPKPAALVTERALDALDGVSPSGKTFLFLHYWDTHHPREPREPYYTRYSALTPEELDDGPRVSDRLILAGGVDEEQRLEMLRYASEVSYTDRQLGVLFSGLKRRGLYDQALIILTSDHGEGFLDHPPHRLHGDHVYQDQISVPCILKFPEGSARPAILDRPTATVDLMPTLLHAIGVQAPPDIEGEVVLRIRGTGAGGTGGSALYCEATTPHLGQEVHPNEVGTTWLNERKRRCIRVGDYKYISHPFDPKEPPQLYDLSVDWAERVNLLETAPGEYEAMAAELHARLMEWTHGSGGVDPQLSEDMTEADVEALKALGYL